MTLIHRSLSLFLIGVAWSNKARCSNRHGHQIRVHIAQGHGSDWIWHSRALETWNQSYRAPVDWYLFISVLVTGSPWGTRAPEDRVAHIYLSLNTIECYPNVWSSIGGGGRHATSNRQSCLNGSMEGFLHVSAGEELDHCHYYRGAYPLNECRLQPPVGVTPPLSLA